MYKHTYHNVLLLFLYLADSKHSIDKKHGAHLVCLPQQRSNLKSSLQSMLSAEVRGREAELRGPANPVGLIGMMG